MSDNWKEIKAKLEELQDLCENERAAMTTVIVFSDNKIVMANQEDPSGGAILRKEIIEVEHGFYNFKCAECARSARAMMGIFGQEMFRHTIDNSAFKIKIYLEDIMDAWLRLQLDYGEHFIPDALDNIAYLEAVKITGGHGWKSIECEVCHGVEFVPASSDETMCPEHGGKSYEWGL